MPTESDGLNNTWIAIGCQLVVKPIWVPDRMSFVLVKDDEHYKESSNLMSLTEDVWEILKYNNFTKKKLINQINQFLL